MGPILWGDSQYFKVSPLVPLEKEFGAMLETCSLKFKKNSGNTDQHLKTRKCDFEMKRS